MNSESESAVFMLCHFSWELDYLLYTLHHPKNLQWSGA